MRRSRAAQSTVVVCLLQWGAPAWGQLADSSSAQSAISAALRPGGAAAALWPSGTIRVCAAQWPGFVMPAAYLDGRFSVTKLKDTSLKGAPSQTDNSQPNSPSQTAGPRFLRVPPL
jgi:hypothetical protein